MYYSPMKTLLAIPLSTLAAVLLTSCASPAGGAGSRSQTSGPRKDPNLITVEELSAHPATTLYEAVRALRPAWMMRSRPTAVLPQNQGQLLVYVDGTRFGNMASLRQLTTNGVVAVRFLSPGSAEARYGLGHLLGAIEITTFGR